ncbi:MAG TPA: PIN domain-containing protein [Chthoniobacter sp.]|jgi:predicted nucleic acid-binding protein
MSGAVLLDTGPLVSFLAGETQHSQWVQEQWAQIPPPMLTCEAVLTESALILEREGVEADPIFELLERKVIRVAMQLDREQADLRTLMRRYRHRPMSLAEACLVRLSELHRASTVFTLDADFRIYRRHGNKAIALLIPED